LVDSKRRCNFRAISFWRSISWLWAGSL